MTYKAPASAVPAFEFLHIMSGAPAAVDAARYFKHAESFTGYLRSLSLGGVFAVKAITGQKLPAHALRNASGWEQMSKR